MGWAAAALAAVICSLVAAEMFSYGTKTGVLFVRLAVRLLPPDQRDRYREEWTADVLTRSDGDKHHLSAMSWGLFTIPVAGLRSKARHRLPAWLQTDHSDPLILGLTSGLIFGLTGGLIGGLNGGLFVGLIGGLFVGLFGGLFVGLFGGLSARPIGTGLSFGLSFGLIVGLIFGLSFGLFGGLCMFVMVSGKTVLGRLRGTGGTVSGGTRP